MAKMKLNTSAMQHSNLDTGLAMLFGGSTPTTGQQLENIPINMIDTHPNQHRWSMNEDELNWLTNNIAQVGVLQPVSTMKKPDGRYLLLAGHRRKLAAARAGLTEIPALVEPYDEARADIIFNATNLGQRQHLRPSEKAFAYLDLERAVGSTKKTPAAIAELTGDNVRMIQRYKRLTMLLPELIEMVDSDAIPVFAGEALASLNSEEQAALLTVMGDNDIKKISLKQAKELQTASTNATDDLSEDEILAVFRPADYPDWLSDMVMKFLELYKQTPRHVDVECLKNELGKNWTGVGDTETDVTTSPKGIQFRSRKNDQSVSFTWAKFEAYCRSLAPTDEKPMALYRSELGSYIPSTLKTEQETMDYIVQALRYWQESHPAI